MVKTHCDVYGAPFIDIHIFSMQPPQQRKAKRLPCCFPPSASSPLTLFKPSAVCFSQVTEISMGEFLMHSSVVWLNPHPSLGRIRKDPEMTVFGELPFGLPLLHSGKLSLAHYSTHIS